MSVASTPGEQNPYAFIMNPAPAPKHSFLGGDNKALKLLVIVAGATFVIIVLAVILTSVLSKSSPDATLTTLAQEQTELIRVATQGETQATAESTKGFAYNIDLSIGTNQQQLLAYLSKHGVKIKEKQLTLKQDASTDTLLTNAKATSTYDSALQKVLKAQLEAYIIDIQKAYKEAHSSELKTLLDSSFGAAKTLLIQTESSSGS